MESVSQLQSQRRLFVLTICAGSFLLFLVQPMIARMALPRLGGAPSVWNSAMLVYQGLLLIGYAYAHWLGGRAPQVQRWAHVGMFALAAIMLPIGLMGGELPANANPLVWVPWLLLGSIGPLFLVISAQAPLMQRWFALSGGEDPYPLYAASNLGSFAGLLSYPLLVEPLVSVAQQSLLWSVGYAVVLVLVLLCGRMLPRENVVSSSETVAASTPPPSMKTMVYWAMLAAIPSGLMLSTSLHLTTDIMAMPLLWVLPLGIYLLSFSVGFADRQTFAELCVRFAPLILLFSACGTFLTTAGWPVTFALLTLLNLFLVSVSLHNAMFVTRPAPEHLTRFYLVMSVGGVVGGIFCALLAPMIFNWTFEHPLLLVAAALAMKRDALFDWSARLFDTPRKAVITTLTVLVMMLLLSLSGKIATPGSSAAWILQVSVGLMLLIAIVSVGQRLAFAGCIAFVMLGLGGWEKLSSASKPGQLTRSYFGIYSIDENTKLTRKLVHGTTVHGAQNLAPGKETLPTTYYAPLSGIGLAMAAAPQMFGPDAAISVVGLGTGTLSCYARPEQSWKFYEIDPAIVTIAKDEKRFTFLSRCAPNAPTLLGDARLVIAKQPEGQRDILAVDAFSSDAVPMHLLTHEAFEIYKRYLKKDGLLMVHISNRFLDLGPVVAAAAAEGGWHARLRTYRPDKAGVTLNFNASDWVALSRDPKTLDALTNASPKGGWQPIVNAKGAAPWTDDYASILPSLRLFGN
jgi:hypothetical protein